jgi:hypothetical protein
VDKRYLRKDGALVRRWNAVGGVGTDASIVFVT